MASLRIKFSLPGSIFVAIYLLLWFTASFFFALDCEGFECTSSLYLFLPAVLIHKTSVFSELSAVPFIDLYIFISFIINAAILYMAGLMVSLLGEKISSYLPHQTFHRDSNFLTPNKTILVLIGVLVLIMSFLSAERIISEISQEEFGVHD